MGTLWPSGQIERSPEETTKRNINQRFIVSMVCLLLACGLGVSIGYLAYKVNNSGEAEHEGKKGSAWAIGDDIARLASESYDFSECGFTHNQRRPTFNSQGNGRYQRVVGGKQVTIEKYPWQVSLWVNGQHVCGGVLVATNWVLFASHCVIEFPHAREWTAHAGTSDQSKLSSNVAQTSHATDLIVHSDFTQRTYQRDIALLRLAKSFTYNDQVRPICLPTTQQEGVRAGARCEVTGWGALYEGGAPTNRLRAVDVTVLDRSQCNQRHWLGGLVRNDMLCAGSEDGSRDACQGDSGGPMSCFDAQTHRYFLRGVVSWGIGCGKPQMPGVYTHITRLADWVRGVMVHLEELRSDKN